MSCNILHIIALTLLVIVVVQQIQAQPDPSPDGANTLIPSTTRRTTISTTTTSTTTRRPIILPTCRPAPNCTTRSPSVCGRNRSGMCRRFDNICHLHGVNCPQGRPIQSWSNAPLSQCRNLRKNSIGRCRMTCPRRPRRCPLVGQRICVRSRNGQQCRLVANACDLRNLNCHGTPRGNWRRTEMNRCSGMCVGCKPQRCARG